MTELGQEDEAEDSLRYSRNNDEEFFEANIRPELDKIMEKRTLPSNPKAAKLAWELGGALGNAAFLSVQEGGSDKAKTALAEATQYAKSLKVTVPAFPAKGQSREEDFRNVLGYLKQSMNKVAPEIDKANGRQAAMCFDLAMSSLTLLLVYRTNSPALKGQLLDLIKRAGHQAVLPINIGSRWWRRLKLVPRSASSSRPFGTCWSMSQNISTRSRTRSLPKKAKNS